MSRMKMYIEDSLYLNAEKLSEKTYRINLSNGKEIVVKEHPSYNGGVWAWQVESQIFSNDDDALCYLERLIGEKLTGKRIIYHAKSEVPNICGVDGRGCRSVGSYNKAGCSRCPVAEAYFAERDGVELIYAVSGVDDN